MGLRTGWEQPNWFALPGDEPGYKPSFRRTNWFEPVGRECEIVLNRVGIIDLSPYGKIEVKGKDAASFMDTVCANELPKVSDLMFSNVELENFHQCTFNSQTSNLVSMAFCFI